MTPTQIAAIKCILAYFDSGNSVPVGVATIKANCAEVAALRAALAEPAPVQQPAPPADVPMLTPGEVRKIIAYLPVFGEEPASVRIARAVEQLVRQKAGLP